MYWFPLGPPLAAVILLVKVINWRNTGIIQIITEWTCENAIR